VPARPIPREEMDRLKALIRGVPRLTAPDGVSSGV
jgi:hypothetical protein